MNGQDTQRAINEQVTRHVPQAWSSVVAIVMEHGSELWQIGTGTLFQIADVGFVVSAAHVVRSAIERRKVLGFSAPKGFVPAASNWIVSAEYQNAGLDPDPFDVAIYRIPATSMERLGEKTFLQIRDVSFADPKPGAVYTLFGFPGLWSEVSGRDDELLIVKPLEFTTYAYTGPVDELLNYKPKYHILLDASVDDVTGPDGLPTAFADKEGRNVEFPRGLHGISGCCVWRIGNLHTPIHRWSEEPAAVVAVETGVYQKFHVIRATRWVAVTTAIYKAFADLRPAIDLWR